MELNYVSQEHCGWFAFTEIETKHFLVKFLRDDAVLVDVGANIEMYSALFLQLSSKSQVYAVEPSSNFQFLEKKIPRQLKSRFKVFQVALGDINGMVVSEIWEAYGHNKVKDYFQSLTFDKFCESEQLEKIDLVKIDTDGYETQILKKKGGPHSPVLDLS
jgi:FkbM family methyltransferase